MKYKNLLIFKLVILVTIIFNTFYFKNLYAMEIKFPTNNNTLEVPIITPIRVCINDNLLTTEITINEKFNAFLINDNNKIFISGKNLNLKVKNITFSKKAQMKYYVILKTFPYSNIENLNKKNEIINFIQNAKNIIKDKEITFFTYGCILKPKNKNINKIDIRTLFLAYGPFDLEDECLKTCNNLRNYKIFTPFVHPIRITNSICRFNVEIKMIDNKTNKTKIINYKDISKVYLKSNISGNILVKNVEFGRGESWNRFKDVKYLGAIEISPDNNGLIQIINEINFEDFLKSIVPSEIESNSPYQAICAQAIAARTELLAKIKTRHQESDYDFCASPHCQAYNGLLNRNKLCDKAVDETFEKIIFSNDGYIVDAVYHANCGGITENSNKIWSAPFEPTLISIMDSTTEILNLSTNETLIRQFIFNPPLTYCSIKHPAINLNKFRWQREFKFNELNELINKQFDIGLLETIEVIERGNSGRIIALKIKGSKKSEIIYKELPIRRLFKMLNSSLFVIDEKIKNNEKYIVFSGAGWGHGVGMCQDGAKGMAISNKTYEEILLHYYSNSKIINLNDK